MVLLMKHNFRKGTIFHFKVTVALIWLQGVNV